MTDIEAARKVAADMLRSAGDEEGARVVDRLSCRWEAVEWKDAVGRTMGRFNVTRVDPTPCASAHTHYEFFPEIYDMAPNAEDARRLVTVLNKLTCGVLL